MVAPRDIERSVSAGSSLFIRAGRGGAAGHYMCRSLSLAVATRHFPVIGVTVNVQYQSLRYI